jgi:hypothetical protein
LFSCCLLVVTVRVSRSPLPVITHVTWNWLQFVFHILLSTFLVLPWHWCQLTAYDGVSDNTNWRSPRVEQWSEVSCVKVRNVIVDSRVREFCTASVKLRRHRQDINNFKMMKVRHSLYGLLLYSFARHAETHIPPSNSATSHHERSTDSRSKRFWHWIDGDTYAPTLHSLRVRCRVMPTNRSTRTRSITPW